MASRMEIDPTYLDMANNTRGILFLGTPMRGAQLADFAAGVAQALFFLDVNDNILDLLRPKSQKL
jgi:hypothetical protein